MGSIMKLCIDNRERLRIPAFESYIKSGKSKFIDDIELGNYFTDIHTPDLLVGIEYKEEDLMESIYSGLLDKQLKELKDSVQYPFLFIGYEGISDTIIKNIGSNPDVILGKLASIVSRQKVTIMFVSDFLVPFTIKVIDRFYDGETPVKLSNYTPIRNKPKKKKPTINEIKRHIICDLPGLGSEKGNRVLQRYDNSISKIASTTEDDLKQIKGIGPKLAKEILEIFK